ncbi:MAG: ribosome biogenesis GTPase Der [Epsilonproteobacteria bacterium]|nr:ribosome biogenesis GTPase Der [Campylobacterota bacterium]
MENLKKVAIIGRPNVGKSSLFNRLLKKRVAITSDVIGTTRDVKKRVVTTDNGREFELLDTGGIDDTTEMFQRVKELSLKSAKEADIIIFMVDGKEIPQDEDRRLFYQLQSLKKPIALVVNKIDNDRERDKNFWEFTQFGAKDIFGISITHNRYMNNLYRWLESHIPQKEERDNLELIEDFDPLFDNINSDIESDITDEEDNREINVAIIGRVNSGKSSLLNALLKEDRAVVSDVAGTTIDPVDESIEYRDYKITFIDTAGIRRRGKIVGIEKYALYRTEEMLKEADIALLVIDATTGVLELDEKIANLIDKHRLASLIVINKWDIRGELSYEEMVENIRYKLKFLHYTELITVSAKTKQRVHKILDEIVELYRRYSRRIPTSKLNEVIKFATIKHHIPTKNGAVVKIKYATQYAIKPPKIALIMNRPDGLHFSYKRYLINTLRENFDFRGVPIDIIARKRGEREEE